MSDKQDLFDAVVIGGGPAGLTAALYLARARYRVLVIEKDKIGGQATTTDDVVNYPGIERTSGEALTRTMRQQALNFGAEFLGAEVTGIDVAGDVKVVHTGAGDRRCFGIVLATGAAPRAVGFAGEERFKGRGVAYCATCDGEFFTGLDVFVVGGGLAAADESVFLTKYARHVTLLVRGTELKAPKANIEDVESNPKITVLYNTVMDEVTGDSMPRAARYHNTVTNEVTSYQAPDGKTFGTFVFVGLAPATELVKNIVELDGQGYVTADPSTMATAVPGVYAAGDVRPKALRQVVTATSDGAVAATELERHIAAMQTLTGLVPKAPVRELDPTTTSQAPTAAPADAPSVAPAPGGGYFNADIRAQLAPLFARFENPLTLRVVMDGQPIAAELKGYLTELAGLSGGKVAIQVVDGADAQALGGLTPRVDVFRQELETGTDPAYCDYAQHDELRSAQDDETGGRLTNSSSCVEGTGIAGSGQSPALVDTGLSFGGVPGGHEFNSFVLGLYNAAGPGQPLDDATKARIASIDKPVDIRILVSLSCTMCPETVMASQHIAALNPGVTAKAYDVAHFPGLREEYNVMSVPCILIDDQEPHFGKKSVAQMLDLIGR